MVWRVTLRHRLNSLRPRQNGRHFADDFFKRIFLNENVSISIKNSLKFVPGVLIYNIPALVQIMAWRRQGDKPLSEPMMISLLTHICVTRPQWVNHINLPSARSHDIHLMSHYNDVIMGSMAFQITSLAVVYSTVYSGTDQRHHQRSATLALVRGIHRWSVNSHHKWPVTRKRFPSDDVIMIFIGNTDGIHCWISFEITFLKVAQLYVVRALQNFLYYFFFERRIVHLPMDFP